VFQFAGRIVTNTRQETHLMVNQDKGSILGGQRFVGGYRVGHLLIDLSIARFWHRYVESVERD